mmetsp:Transcript_44109/g.136697  ORF Transcript_44109/g.136697 Transcript_44109/m.136697 type:complete len:223 (+) Transcript_44109:184-852(+)
MSSLKHSTRRVGPIFRSSSSLMAAYFFTTSSRASSCFLRALELLFSRLLPSPRPVFSPGPSLDLPRPFRPVSWLLCGLRLSLDLLLSRLRLPLDPLLSCLRTSSWLFLRLFLPPEPGFRGFLPPSFSFPFVLALLGRVRAGLGAGTRGLRARLLLPLPPLLLRWLRWLLCLLPALLLHLQPLLLLRLFLRRLLLWWCLLPSQDLCLPLHCLGFLLARRRVAR